MAVKALPGWLKPEMLELAEAMVPRYTSYPTAAQFTHAVDGATQAEWLAGLTPAEPLSLYLHVPFCHQLCWYCGCHTSITKSQKRIDEYVDLLCDEIELVAAAIADQRNNSGPVQHVHLGGGSPNSLSPGGLIQLGQYLRQFFPLADDAEMACELDPRQLSDCFITALSSMGINRVSLGVQDLNPAIQKAINREQPLPVVASAVSRLRRRGIEAINLDLMYGLPEQQVADVERTIAAILPLQPDRIAVFGYAHVPWFKKHQALIPAENLPGTLERLLQADAARQALTAAGYIEIGMDHYALPGDPMAVAWKQGRRQRNFQGFTTDSADTLIGLGVSSISSLPQGYVQNAGDIAAYRRAISSGQLAGARGVAVGEEDHLRSRIINKLMCELPVDLAAEAIVSGMPTDHFDPLMPALEALSDKGLIRLDGTAIEVTPLGRRFTRNIACIFDAYLGAGKAGDRHSRAS